MIICKSALPVPRLRGWKEQRGFTLVEALVSLAVLVVTGVGGVSGFMLLNRYASDNRDLSAAKALCQERIEQVLTLPYRPKDAIGASSSSTSTSGSTTTTTSQNGDDLMPHVVSQQDPGVVYYLLGHYTDYDTYGHYKTSGIQQTSGTAGEPVVLALQPNGTNNAVASVTGTRLTTVTNVGTTAAPLVYATVTVNWTIRGQAKTYSLFALRSPD